MYNTSKKGVTMVRKYFKISLLLLGAVGFAQADDGISFNNSKTFFWIRPPFQSSLPEKETLWRDRALARECGVSGAFQIVPFGGRSVKASEIAEYFMFCHKSELNVATGNLPGLPTNPNLRDVNAADFNIAVGLSNPAFQSTIKFRPRHSFAGVGFDYKQYLAARDACEKKWWMEISFPVLHVKNDMRLSETSNGVAPLNANVNANMVEAFKGLKGYFNPSIGDGTVTGSAWKYGKINGPRKKTGVADIELKLGYDYLCEEMCHAESYIGGLIPTGNRAEAHYVFEPIVGHGKHGGLIWGASWGWEVWNSCDRYLHFEMATNGKYLFKNTQHRSFDVKGKPWSRYMLVYNNASDAANQAVQDGINVFTRKVEVRPRFQKDLNSAFVYTSCGFQAELGYNFWAKDAEKIKLDRPWEGTQAFAAIDDAGGSAGANLINRAITIKETFEDCNVAYGANLAIRAQDLDLQSASSPSALTHTFYGSLGYRWDDWCYPTFVGLGGSYELADDYGAISRWTIWGKFGVSI
jgi:hypothetical protein